MTGEGWTMCVRTAEPYDGPSKVADREMAISKSDLPGSNDMT